MVGGRPRREVVGGYEHVRIVWDLERTEDGGSDGGEGTAEEGTCTAHIRKDVERGGWGRPFPLQQTTILRTHRGNQKSVRHGNGTGGRGRSKGLFRTNTIVIARPPSRASFLTSAQPGTLRGKAWVGIMRTESATGRLQRLPVHKKNSAHCTSLTKFLRSDKLAWPKTTPSQQRVPARAEAGRRVAY